MAAWQARYLGGKTGWDRGEPSSSLLEWLRSGELTPCRIVVPGCGNGHEVIELSSRGFDVIGVDFAPAPVEALRRRLREEDLHAEVLQSDMFQLKFKPTVDAVFEQTCLCAIQPTRRQEYEKLLAQWLKPGRKLFVNFMQTHRDGGPPFHCNLDEMRETFRESEWHWPNGPLEKIPHPSGLYEMAAILIRN